MEAAMFPAGPASAALPGCLDVARPLTLAAEQVRRRYLDSHAYIIRPPSASLLRMQEAFVAYVDAYGRAYPAEAHLLPDVWKGQRLPEFEAFRIARNDHEGAR